MIVEPFLKCVKSAGHGAAEPPGRAEPLCDNERGMLRLDIETCIGCSACSKMCPTKTITMVEKARDRKSMLLPQVGLDRCIFCGFCEEVCPTRCLTLTKCAAPGACDRRELVKRPEELRG